MENKKFDEDIIKGINECIRDFLVKMHKKKPGMLISPEDFDKKCEQFFNDFTEK